jgi:hypothetical protein
VITFTFCPIYPAERGLSTHSLFWRRETPDRPPHDIVLIRFILCDNNIKEKQRRHLLQPLLLMGRIFLSHYHDPVRSMTNVLTSSNVLRNFRITGKFKKQIKELITFLPPPRLVSTCGNEIAGSARIAAIQISRKPGSKRLTDLQLVLHFFPSYLEAALGIFPAAHRHGVTSNKHAVHC